MSAVEQSYRDFALDVASDLGLGNVKSAELLWRGRMTIKVELRTISGDRFLVRMYPPGRESISQYEPLLLHALFRAGASVPEPIKWESHGERPFLVYRMIPGTSLEQEIDRMSDLQVRNVAAACKDQLKTLSRLPVEGWGDLVTIERAEQETWDKFVTATVAAVKSLSAHPDLDAAVAFIANIRRKPCCSPSLVWTDISPENIIVDQKGCFAGIVDLESVMALEPAATRGYLLARYARTRFGAIFKEALQDWANSPALDLVYAVIRGLRLLPHQATPLPSGLARDSLDVVLPGLNIAAQSLAMLAASNGGGYFERDQW